MLFGLDKLSLWVLIMQNSSSQLPISLLNQSKSTGKILFSDGTSINCQGFGATGIKVGELCFNTSMTGYQEIITDPSYCNQIVCFTFPHIGNVGINQEDYEATEPRLAGIITKWQPTKPSNWRSEHDLDSWLKVLNLIGITGVDTRLLTQLTRQAGAPNVAIFNSPDEEFDIEEGQNKLNAFGGLKGLDLAPAVSAKKQSVWQGALWEWPEGHTLTNPNQFKVATLDFGVKKNILRCLSSVGCHVRNFPYNTDYQQIIEWQPDGLFLSNGPGDPAATAEYIVPLLQKFINETAIPIFGICLGHQMLALALGCQTTKMSHGHHGANHPVKEIATGKVEITTMNHGFTVDSPLPAGVEETHISLFDGTNCGIRLKDRPIFSVQFHPEASPGPQDSYYLFKRFAQAMLDNQASNS